MSTDMLPKLHQQKSAVEEKILEFLAARGGHDLEDHGVRNQLEHKLDRLATDFEQQEFENSGGASRSGELSSLLGELYDIGELIQDARDDALASDEAVQREIELTQASIGTAER